MNIMPAIRFATSIVTSTTTGTVVSTAIRSLIPNLAELSKLQRYSIIIGTGIISTVSGELFAQKVDELVFKPLEADKVKVTIETAPEDES